MVRHSAPITLEWSHPEATAVVGRLNAASGVELILEAYLPQIGANSEGVFSVSESDGSILVERYFDGAFGSTLKFLIATDRPLVSSGTYGSLEDLRKSMLASGRLSSSGDPTPGAAGIEFTPDGARKAHFVAIVGPSEAELRSRAHEWLSSGAIDTLRKKIRRSTAIRDPW